MRKTLARQIIPPKLHALLDGAQFYCCEVSSEKGAFRSAEAEAGSDVTRPAQC